MVISKKQVLQTVDSFSGDEINPEELMQKIFVLMMIAEGLADLEAGRTVPHEQIKKEFGLL